MFCYLCSTEKSNTDFYLGKRVCKNCNTKRAIEWRRNNPLKSKAISKKNYNKTSTKNRQKNYKQDRKDFFQIYNKDYQHTYNLTGKRSEINKKNTVLLTDSYIRTLMLEQGFSKSSLNEYPELIEIKRFIIKTKRLCKTSQNSE